MLTIMDFANGGSFLTNSQCSSRKNSNELQEINSNEDSALHSTESKSTRDSPRTDRVKAVD